MIFPEACKLTLFAATGLLVRDTGAFTAKLAVTKELLVTIVEASGVELLVVLATKRQKLKVNNQVRGGSSRGRAQGKPSEQFVYCHVTDVKMLKKN